MRTIPLLLGALLATAASAAEAPAAAPAPLSDANKACVECHEAAKPGDAGVRVDVFAKSVHADLSCTDCHEGYEAPGPHELAAPSDPAQAALLGRISAAKGPDGSPASSAPRALLSCGNCHADAADQLKASVHGKWMAEGAKAPGPTCASCHGSPHEVVKIAGRTGTGTAAGRARADDALARERARRCEACHENPAVTEAANLKHDVPLNFRDSIHGRLIAVGSERAPDCADCHGSHAIVSKTNAGSPVAGANRVQTCGKCHEGANENFASLISHKPLQESGVVPHVIHIAFSILTTGTLVGSPGTELEFAL